MGSVSNLHFIGTDDEGNRLSNYRVYVSFCSKDPTTTTSSNNVCNWIECYNPSENSWHRVTSVPGLMENQVLKSFSMVSMGNMIYLIGGRLCHKEVMSRSSRDDDEDEDDDSDFVADIHDIELDVTNTVLRYDVLRDSWSKCSPMKTARCDFACTVSKDNKIYVAGGQSTVGSAKGISLAEVYDPALDEWKSLPNMSTIRYKCVGVTWLGKIYVVGGFAERRDGDSHGSPGPYVMERSSAEVYDYEKQRWVFVARMWDLDVPPNQIVAINGRLLSSGDCLNAWKGHVEAYDGKLNMWVMVSGSSFDALSSPISTETNNSWPSSASASAPSSSSSSSFPVQRLYLTMAPIGMNLYFLAGYKVPGENWRTKTEVHVFDTCANGGGWRSLESIDEDGEKEICCHGCVLKQEP